MSTKKGNKHVNFIMDTDWIFNGVIDAEQKQYVLLDYFQKLNKHLEEMKIYPMFIELSLHLGNIQTLINTNKILYTEKKFTTNDDELLMSDLKVKDIPVLATEEVPEYRKILRNSQPQLYDYFNFAKSLWTVVYDSIDLKVKKNKRNLKSKSGFFYYNNEGTLYVWKYTTKKVYKVQNQTRTHLKEIFKGDKSDLTIEEIISKFSKTYEKDDESIYPIFEVNCTSVFPLKETLLPIFKRKILAYVNQQKVSKIETKTLS
jgi:hypothetical protein